MEVEGVPASPSPITNAVLVGNHCWISGQLSVGPASYIPGTARLPFGGKVKVEAVAARE